MKTNILNILSLSLLVAFLACKTGSEIKQVGDFSVFGEDFEHSKAIAYTDLLAKFPEEGKIEATVKGNISSVCQVKGCWMNMVADGREEELFVKFKDYGFFMPLDMPEGQEVIMHGEAYKEITSVDELRHYAEDEGKSKEEIAAITQAEVELKFMASGVKILTAK